jgi:hypothetical protein
MRIDDGGSSVYTPAQHSLPPPQQQQNTAQAAADIKTTAPSKAAVQTPQQRVDAAVARYDAAVKGGDETAIAQAQQEVNAAVRGEIGPQVDQANANIPPRYQSAPGPQITSYGNIILRRHENDPTAQAVLQGAIGDYQIQRQADDLIPQFYGSFTPKDKLNSLMQSLQGEPAAVVDRVMQNPSVQQWLTDAVSWVAEPYKGVSAQDAKENQQAAADTAQNLADVTSGLPPAYAARVVQQSMPAIEKITGVDALYSGSSAFTSLSRVVGNLGDTPQAQALTKQIAQAYRGQFDTWTGFFDDPRSGIVKAAVGGGASPKLALALADQLQSSGKSDEAGAILRSVESGAETLQSHIGDDMKEYSELTKDLSWMVANSKDKLSATQLQQAINTYIAKQPPEWQNQLREAQNKLMEDTRTLNEDIAALQSVPDGERIAPDALENLRVNIGENETTQKAIEFTSARDPSIFAGEGGSKTASFWAEAGHKSKDFINSLAQAYMRGNVLPVLGNVNPNDPANLAKVNRVLQDFQSKASSMLGIPQNEVDAGVAKLKDLLHTLQTTKITAESRDGMEELKRVTDDLQELKDLHFTNGVGSLAFRTMAFGLSGAVVLNQLHETIENRNAQNIIGSLGLSVGVVQDAAGFGATVGLLDKDSGLGKWGLAAGWLGEHTESFVGLLNIAYYAAGAWQNFSGGQPVTGTLDLFGAGGMTLATFGEAMGLGSWAGPVGWGVTILATGGIYLAERREEIDHHTDIEKDFLAGGGVDEKAAAALSSDGLQEANKVQQQLKLTPDQLQDLAGSHPELFNLGPGVTQSVIDVVKACGIQGLNVKGFVDALAQDHSDYTRRFDGLTESYQGTHPLSYQASLAEMVLHQYPHTVSFLQQHAPGVLTAAAQSRRSADQQWESNPDRSPLGIANLLSGHDAAFQSEVIQIMQHSGSLDRWAKSLGSAYAGSSFAATGRSAIQAAQSSGVLTPIQAQAYLDELG